MENPEQATFDRLHGQLVAEYEQIGRAHSPEPIKSFNTTLAELASGVPATDALQKKLHTKSSYLRSYYARLEEKSEVHDKETCLHACHGDPHAFGYYCRFCKSLVSWADNPAYITLYHHFENKDCNGLEDAELAIFLEAISEADRDTLARGRATRSRDRVRKSKRSGYFQDVSSDGDSGSSETDSENEDEIDSDSDGKEGTPELEDIGSSSQRGKANRSKIFNKASYRGKEAVSKQAKATSDSDAIPVLSSKRSNEPTSSEKGKRRRLGASRKQSVEEAGRPAPVQSSSNTHQARPQVVKEAKARCAATPVSMTESNQRETSISSNPSLFARNKPGPSGRTAPTARRAEASSRSAASETSNHGKHAGRKAGLTVDLTLSDGEGDGEEDKKSIIDRDDLHEILMPWKDLLTVMGVKSMADLSFIKDAKVAKDFVRGAQEDHPGMLRNTLELLQFQQAIKEALNI